MVTKQMGDLPVYSVKPEKEEGPSRTLHRDLLLPCEFLPETEREERDTNRPKRPRTRQQIAIQQDDEPFDLEDESQENWYTTLLDVQDRRFVKVYDIPRHNLALPQHNYGQEAAEPHACHTSATGEKTNSPEEKTNSPEERMVNSSEAKTIHSLGEETGNLPGAETQNPPSEAMDGSSTEIKAKDNANDETSIVEKTSERTGTDTTVRRSFRQREPPRRFHFPELGNPRVSVVTSLFQVLSTALTDSLNDSASRDWFTGTPFGMVESVITQQPFNNAPGRALGKEGSV